MIWLARGIEWILIVSYWELGGQIDKSIRRYGIPSVIFTMTVLKCTFWGGVWWHYLPLALLFPELFLGYGQGSWAASVFKQEWAIRLAYASLMLLPIIITDLACHVRLGWMLAQSVLMLGAFQIMAGGFDVGTLKGERKQFLYEDCFRSTALSLCLWVVL